MNFNRQQLLKWVKYFINLCENNDIWYAADAETLLGAKRHGGFIPWHEKFQVMMTPESYQKLQRLFPSNVIDGSIDPKYKSLKPSFVKSRTSWKAELPFIEIRLLVPTTIPQVKKFKSVIHFLKNKITRRDDNTKIAINDLYAQRYKGYYTITSRFAHPIDNWFANLTLRVKKVRFNTLEIAIPIEVDLILNKLFGDKYMDVNTPNKYYEFPSPTVSVKGVL